MDQKTLNRIQADATKYAFDKIENNDYVDNALCSYIDGATAEYARLQPVVDAPRDLVALKDEKESKGETEYYTSQKQKAWHNARKALSGLEGGEG